MARRKGDHRDALVPRPAPRRISLSDYTVGLERIPGFIPRPSHLARSPDHSSELVGVGRIHHL